MPTIPIYKQQTSVGGVPNLGRVSVEAMTAEARGGQAIAGAVEGVLDQRKKEQQRVEEEDAKVYAAKVIADSQLKWREEMLNRQASAEPGAPDFTPNVLKDFDAYSTKAANNAPTDASRRFIQSQMVDLRTRLGSSALEYESGERIQNRYKQHTDTIKTFAQNIAQAPNEATIAEALANIEATMPEVGPANQAKLRELAQVEFRQSAWLSQLQADPEGVKAKIDKVFKRNTPTNQQEITKPDSAEAIKFILGIEGGRVENDGGAGLTNFGINSKANPDIDVSNLTPEKAAGIYKQRYWDAIQADTLPPDVALMAFDASVNQGPAFARELIAESGGDVTEMSRMRRERYDELAAADPSKAKYLKGWLARVDKVKKKALEINVAEPVKTNGEEKMSWSSGLVRMTPVDELIRYRQQAEQSIKQRQQVAVEAMKTRLTDAAAMADSGIPDPSPMTSQDFLVFGEHAATMYQQYNRTQKMARDISGFTDATNSDLIGVVQGLSAEAQPGEGFAAAEKRDSIRKQSALRVLEMRDKDPAGYVAKTVPSVKQSALVAMDESATAEQRQSATQNAVTESLAAQQRLGVRNPKILSKGQVEWYGEKILMASKPEDVSDFVTDIEQQYGNGNFRRVMGELMQENKLPPSLMIIPDLDSPAAREMVARMGFVKTEALKAGIEKSDVTTINEEVSEKVSELAMTIPATSKNNAALLEAYEETTQKIAMQLVQNGVKITDAVDRAANLLWGQKYTMEGTIRKPKAVDYDVEDKAMAKLRDEAVSLDIPPDLFQARTDIEAKQEWLETVQSNAKWYTSGDGKGVQLWASGMNGVVYRVTQNGKQVTYSFDDLRGKSTIPKAQRSRLQAFEANTRRAQEVNRLMNEAAQ